MKKNIKYLVLLVVLLLFGCEGLLPTDTYKWNNDEEYHWKENEQGEKKEYNVHNFSNWTISKEPTCTEDGLESSICSECGYIKMKNLKALGHSYGEATYTWNETNTHLTAKHVCIHDESHIETEIVNVTYEIIKEPTCLTDGLGRYTSNTFTNTTFKEQTKDITLNKLGHDLITYDSKDATCTEIGWNEYDTCSRCSYTTYSELKAIGHSYGEWVSNNNGTHTHTCLNDNAHIETKNCTFGEWITVTEAGPFTEGLEKHICTSCEYEETRVIASTHVHSYSSEFTVDKEPTCEETGLKSKHCIIDGCTSTIEETIIPVKEHSFGEVEYIWSDDYQILTAKHYCINNEEHYEIESVKTIYEIKKEPTCTNTGIGLYTSIDFNNSSFSKQSVEIEIQIKEHEYLEEITESTCEKQGYITHICKYCDNSYIKEYLDYSEHLYVVEKYEWTNESNIINVNYSCKNNKNHIKTETLDIVYYSENDNSKYMDQYNRVGFGEYTIIVGNKVFIMPKYGVIKLDGSKNYSLKENLQVYGTDGFNQNVTGLIYTAATDTVKAINSYGHGALYQNVSEGEIVIPDVALAYGRELPGVLYGYHKYQFVKQEDGSYTAKLIGASGECKLAAGDFLWCPMYDERKYTGFTDCDGTSGVLGVLSDNK